MTPPRVWVDTDVALGSRAGDVDDGFAIAGLLGAAAERRVELLGVSTVSGNCETAEAERCARALLAAAGADVRVVRGAGRAGPAAEGRAAAEALVELPEDTEVVAIGPLSNLAAALSLDPGFARRVRIAVVGGNLTSRGFLPPLWPHEFNLAYDRKAARSVLAAKWRDLVLYPLDVLVRFRCDSARLEGLTAAGVVGRLLARESARWLRRSRWTRGPGGFPVWDLVPALVAAGALDVRIEDRTFPAVQRAFAGIPDPVRAAVDFDPADAWRAFEYLLGVPAT